MKFSGDDDGRRTLFGHELTHNWQAVQWSVKFFRLDDPAGTTGVVRSCFLFMPVNGTLLPFFASAVTAVPTISAERKNALRPESVFSSPAALPAFLAYLLVYDIAPSLQLSRQSIHATHLL